MRRLMNILCLALLVVLTACQSALPPPSDRPPERIESRVGGPERVFARPVTDIVPLLQNARATGPNGRVGYEMVFWGYELSGQPASLVACAVLPNVDCEARLAQVCESGAPEVLFTGEEGGEVRFLNCQAIGIAQPGDLTPNCTDTEQIQPVTVTLLSCQ